MDVNHQKLKVIPSGNCHKREGEGQSVFHSKTFHTICYACYDIMVSFQLV